jgi:cyclic beta-1,2-glucan synthetase
MRPWINVLSNPHFGAQVSETAAGYTWAVNSRLNQLTAWSNDPVSDPPAEWFILQDLHTGDAWSVSPNAWSDAHAQYAVTHGQGYTRIEHRRGDLSITAQWCVDPLTSVKQITLNITNHGHQTAELRLTGCIEWIMGEQRRDRSTTFTSASHRHLPGSEVCLADPTQRHTGLLTILLCTQLNQSAGFGGGSAFFTLCRQADDAQDWTCDRREFFNTCGEFVLPTQARSLRSHLNTLRAGKECQHLTVLHAGLW